MPVSWENYVLQMLPSQTRLPTSSFQQFFILPEASVIKSATKIAFPLTCFVCCPFPNNGKFINDFEIRRTSYLPLFNQNQTLEQDSTYISKALPRAELPNEILFHHKLSYEVFRNLTLFLLCWV